MDREQEDLIVTGIWLLIKNNDKISSAEKQVWMMDYDNLFGEDTNLEKGVTIDKHNQKV